MSLISLYSLFFAIAIGALAPTEARLVPAAENLPEVAVQESSVHSADQAHKNDDVVPIEREKVGQKKSSVAKTVTKIVITAAILALVALFSMRARKYLRDRKELKILEQDVKREDKWAGKSDEEIKKEAKRRYERIKEIMQQKEEEWKGYTLEERVDLAWREEMAEREWAEFEAKNAEQRAKLAEANAEQAEANAEAN